MTHPRKHNPLSRHMEVVAGVFVGLIIGIGALALVRHSMPPAVAPESLVTAPAPSSVAPSPPAVAPRILRADFGAENPTGDVRYMANWIADSRDAGGLPFVIVDKKDAKVYVFDGGARLLGATPVLLGAAPGDDTAPGVGSRPLTQVAFHERTTPAGRFVGERGHNARGEDVVWVDYDAAVSMHRVLTNNPDERRLERLATPTNADNRVSYGCINVPVAFYEKFLRPTFASKRAIVYVLPEVKSLQQVFGAYDVAMARGVKQAEMQNGPGGDALMMLLVALRSK